MRQILTGPDGIIPKVDDKMLPDNAAQTAQNLELRGQRWEPLLDHSSGSLDNWQEKSLNPNYDVVQSPVSEDTYDTWYYSGHANGYLRMAGSFGERNVHIPEPDAPSGVSGGDMVVDPEADSWTLNAHVRSGASVSCSINKVSREYGGLNIRFYFPGYSEQSASAFYWPPKYQLVIPTVGNIPTTVSSTSHILAGETLDIADGTTKVAEVEPASVTEDMTYVKVLISPPVHVFGSGYIDLFVDMNFATTEKYLYYVTTFVDDLGQEGPPGEISNFVHRQAGQEVELTGIDNSNGDGNTSKVRIYRSVAIETGEDDFWYVDEINYGTTTYTDSKNDDELSEPLVIFDNPPSNLKGLVGLPNGAMAGFVDHTVWFSEPNYPNQWPASYGYTFDEDVVGLAVTGNDLVVLTDGNPYYATGAHPESFRRVKLMQNQACVSKESITQIGPLITYASPDGIVGITAGGAELLTKVHFKRSDWQDYNPKKMICCAHDRKLYIAQRKKEFLDASPATDEGGGLVSLPCTAHGFSTGDAISVYGTTNYDGNYTVDASSTDDKIVITSAFSAETFATTDYVARASGLLVFDIEGEGIQALTTDTTEVEEMFSDLTTDNLYIRVGGSIQVFGGGTDNRKYTWKSRTFQMTKPMGFSVLKVIAETYSTTSSPTDERIHVKFYGDGTELLDYIVQSGKAYRIPRMQPQREWSFQIESYDEIDSVFIAQGIEEVM